MTKSNYLSKYGKMKIIFFKILLWMEYFEHKEASVQVSSKSIMIWQNYACLKKCGPRHRRRRQNLDCYFSPMRQRNPVVLVAWDFSILPRSEVRFFILHRSEVSSFIFHVRLPCHLVSAWQKCMKTSNWD